jgi:protein-disulfide isomerase
LTGLAVATVTAVRSDAPLKHAFVVPSWPSLTRDGQRIGPDTARVTILLLVDYECSQCIATAITAEQMRVARPGAVRLVVRHAPRSSVHPGAMAAALAAECAAVQNRFPAYHSELLSRRGQLDAAVLKELAIAAGVPDRTAFGECIDRARFAGAVRRDLEAVQRFGPVGSVVALVNGIALEPDDAQKYLERLVNQLLTSDRPA